MTKNNKNKHLCKLFTTILNYNINKVLKCIIAVKFGRYKINIFFRLYIYIISVL